MSAVDRLTAFVRQWDLLDLDAPIAVLSTNHPEGRVVLDAADIKEVLAQRAAVLALHDRGDPDSWEEFCPECKRRRPCKTARALGVTE